jgi:hypothetical protein
LHPGAYKKILEHPPGFNRGELTVMYSSERASHRNVGYINGKMESRLRLHFEPFEDCSYILEHTMAREQDESKVDVWRHKMEITRAQWAEKWAAEKHGKQSAKN